MKPISELRFDLVSNDWVVIATGRAKRPGALISHQRKIFRQPKKTCPFDHMETQKPPVLTYYKNNKSDWRLMVIPNKYPAFIPGDFLRERAEGPYSLMDGVGFHEVVVTRDHDRQIAQFSIEEIKQVIRAYQERYLALMNKKFINYISIFHNHGLEAGASVAHPHSQIIAIPAIDQDLQSSLDGSRRFFENRGQCVHCVILDWERENKQRLVYENEQFIVVCPFAPRVGFEIRVYPKKHQAYFEKITTEERDDLADALGAALRKIFKGLKDPAYNFFIHTAPCDGRDYHHYHWHFEILPKTSTWAGFELGTGIEISVIKPEAAAQYLRGVK